MTWHEEALDEGSLGALRTLGPVMTELGLYLGGGTAVALHLGHRRSRDLDWFSRERVADVKLLLGELRRAGTDPTVDGVERGTLHCRVAGMMVSLMEYPYPLLEETVTVPELGLELASLSDLAAMKLSAIAQRGSVKDFLDVYAVGRSGMDLPGMLGLYRQKYAIEDISHVLYGLSYFDDADGELMPVCLWDLDWEEVKSTIRSWVGELAR